jgi:hypothetical protein
VKTILKLIVVALLANALWRVGTAYASFYKFKDSIFDAAMQPGSTEEDLKQKIVELAATYDLPLKPDALTVDRDVHRTAVQASFTKPVAILPGYDYPWPFTVDIDAYVIAPPTRRGDLIKP